MTFLKLENIHKVYEGEPLLSGIDLEIAQGEIISLLGPSGSGKTTLLRIIAGLEPCERGRVLLEDRDITRVPAHRRGIILMFQDYALFPHRTVAENVAFGLRMHRLPKSQIAARVQEMLALVGLKGFDDRNVIELSGGERQRVALARSLAPSPRLLLLDEPLGSLDRNLRERLLEDLAIILRRVGVTVISVTHDQAEAFTLADRVALLHRTQIVQIGKPEWIYQNPATPWVAQFLGFTNLLPATVANDQAVDTTLGRLYLERREALTSPGSKGLLLILPWGIQLTGDRDIRANNTFTATVTRRIFQGRTTKIELTIGSTVLDLALEMSDRIPKVGQHVEGWIHPDALRWFPQDATT